MVARCSRNCGRAMFPQLWSSRDGLDHNDLIIIISSIVYFFRSCDGPAIAGGLAIMVANKLLSRDAVLRWGRVIMMVLLYSSRSGAFFLVVLNFTPFHCLGHVSCRSCGCISESFGHHSRNQITIRRHRQLSPSIGQMYCEWVVGTFNLYGPNDARIVFFYISPGLAQCCCTTLFIHCLAAALASRSSCLLANDSGCVMIA